MTRVPFALHHVLTSLCHIQQLAPNMCLPAEKNYRVEKSGVGTHEIAAGDRTITIHTVSSFDKVN